MPQIKIHPPKQLPEQAISQQQFEDWQNELEIYLGQDDSMARFMTDGLYHEWQSQERNADRLAAILEGDPDVPEENAQNREARQRELLAKRRRELRTFIGQVAKSASKNMYAAIVRHATSLEWIYNKIREDYDIQTKGIHYLNIVDVTYDPETKTPAGFYHEYRTVMLNNIGRRGETIHWYPEGQRQLAADEVLGPLFEDHILLCVLQLIDPRLPKFVRKYYQLKLGDKRLMDIKTDIFNNIKEFQAEMEAAEQLAALRVSGTPTAASLAAISSSRPPRARGRGRGIPQPQAVRTRTFCKTCYDNDRGRSVYLSHITDAQNCPTKLKLNTIVDQLLPPEVVEHELDEDDQTAEETESQVAYPPSYKYNTISAGLNLIQPVPTQILTVSDENGKVLHLELDSAATVNYITLREAKARNLIISSNSQMSKLGDGATTIMACGEINMTLYRDDLPLTFRALVCKSLHCPVIGGTLFLKENGITQDFTNNTISLLHNRKTVPATTFEATLPVSNQNTSKNNRYNLMSLKTNKIILPGESIEIDTELGDQTVLVEGFNSHHWPAPQVVNIARGKIPILNTSADPVILNAHKVNSIKITPTEIVDWSSPRNAFLSAITTPTQSAPLPDSETIDTITIGETTDEIRDLILAANRRFRKVFSKDLSQGYNGYYGHHECHLNWASQQRPEARKIHVASYNHNLKGVMQELCDDLTAQGVLRIPQQHNIQVQSVCPSFLTRKKRAKDKPLHQLTKHDCRLVVNFNPINEHIKNIPSPMTTVNDIYSQLGKWKEIVVLDLHNAFFQNHMAEEDQQWLGIMTPFSGLRVLARSGQGLLG